jgi:UDP-glucose 4-epimerase
MKTLLITGGTGFFGSILARHLRQKGWNCFNLDRLSNPEDVQTGRMIVADLRDRAAVEEAFEKHGPFGAVCHVAAELAHEAKDKSALWASNVEGTRNVADACRRYNTPKLVFTSTNCLWGKPLNRPVKEDDPPHPVEIYGRSKLAAEKLLSDYEKELDVVIFRSPTIIAPGRVGLLSLLFDFIAENRRIPVIGDGKRPYQFIDAGDYARAIELALSYDGSNVFHVGSDNPVSLKDSYRYAIDNAGSRARLYHLPQWPLLPLMKLCYALGLSPLGPYHYNMIAEEFVFDTSRIRHTLGWKPTKTNGEILYGAYKHYRDHKVFLDKNAASLPPHQRASRAGIIKLLKWLS